MIDLSEYKELYLKTATDLLMQLLKDFPLFANNPADETVLERLHRNAHSLKGQSIAMGYQSTGLLCKELEYIFRAFKEKKITTSEELNLTVADAFQKIYESLDAIKTVDKEEDLTEFIQKVQEVSKITRKI